MAATYSYNVTYTNCAYIYSTTSGGTVFSANLAGAVFDYFTDTAVNNDAIYFSPSFATFSFSNLKINVGTPHVGGTGVWEYWARASYTTAAGWRTMHNITDPSNGFTVGGAHTIVFPVQAGMYATTVNSITGRTWIRYRLTGGTVTEGGANQTAIPQTSNGYLSVVGGTNVAPGTFIGLYDWTVVNAPEVGATRLGTVFAFPNAVLSSASRIKTTNEIIFLGNGGDLAHSFSYMESGTKVGTDGWKDSSYFYICQQTSGSRLQFGVNTKFYGGLIAGFNALADGLIWASAGYLGLGEGEFIGLTVDSQPSGYFGTGINANKMTTKGGLISTSFPTNYPANHRISDPLASILYLYNAGGTVTGLSYPLPTTTYFSFNQGGGTVAAGWTIYWKDCFPAVPTQTATPRAVTRVNTAPTGNMAQVLYYDTSAGTFTDYTTQANNDTAGDVPLSGDTGDCYYFRYMTNGYAGQAPLAFTLTSQTNDYVYIWEYWGGSAWVSMGQTWDLTENFTKSGIVYNSHPQLGSYTVNGTAGYWYRLRIVTPGANTPVCTRIKASTQNGIGTWKINEQYSAIITVEDEAGNKLENASATFTDKDATETALTTDANGLTTQTYFTVNTLQFDPVNGDASYQIAINTKNPYTITIEKAGYETVTLPLVLNKKTELTISMKKVKSELNMSKYL